MDWINIEDRSPNMDQGCLIRLSSGGMVVGSLKERVGSKQCDWWCYFYEGYNPLEETKARMHVTHWIPLPEQPNDNI